MTLRKSGFEGFADGAAIDTVSAGAGETVLTTAVNNPTGVGALRHANAANKLFGNVAAKVGTVATAATVKIGWTFSGGNTTSFRFYIKFTAAPPATLRFFGLTRSSGNAFELSITTGRAIRILDISAATKATFAAIALNTWYRIEGVVNHHATTGSATVSVHNWDETAAIQSLTVTDSAFTGPCTGGDVGIKSALANVPEFFVDELAIDDTGASIGPVAGTLNDPPTLSLAGALQTLGTTVIPILKGQTARVTATAADPEAAGALTYAWSVVSQPSGGTLDLTGQTGSYVDVPGTLSGDYVISCTVTEVGGKTKTAQTTVVVLPRVRV